MKHKDKMKEFQNLTTEEINKKIKDAKEELLKLRMKQATGTLENPARIPELRKDVARLKTILNSRKIEN
ncbi:MAG: 50S ribosomal protein L29 [Bacilli bacterium]|mgnify:FL=1|nr:50S ribosomal protein L29 [Bacilli bacterium]MDY4996189.1 50S ribosomal protein L29 [Bacilli bacterium]